jgi:WD40 repeat protein
MIAANCNTVFHSISFNKKQKLVAYGAANTVLIMDPYHINNNVPKVLFSLKGHEERVNSVSWLTDEILVSVSSDKSLIIWGYDKGTNPRNPLNWKHKKVFKEAHKETINYLSTFSYLPESVGENG